MLRTTICNDGKKRTFSFVGDYYTPENVNEKELFANFEDCKACIAYTTIKDDMGWREVNVYGTPTIEKYNNGPKGYQNYCFFRDIEEATRDFEARKKLSPKVGTIAYCDVFLFIK